jgi:hypothetical protein
MPQSTEQRDDKQTVSLRAQKKNHSEVCGVNNFVTFVIIYLHSHCSTSDAQREIMLAQRGQSILPPTQATKYTTKPTVSTPPIFSKRTDKLSPTP